MTDHLTDTNVGNIEYIRKQEAVSRISDLLVLELKMTRCPTWNEVYNAIGDLPPADVAPVRHARWRHYEGMYACEDCGAQLDDESPFCPMCGAKMDGECREE